MKKDHSKNLFLQSVIIKACLNLQMRNGRLILVRGWLMKGWDLTFLWYCHTLAL